MKLLVTGGLGFIGSNFIRQMLEKHPDYNIVNLDKITYAGNPDNLKDVENHKNYVFVRGDICNGELVAHLLKTHGLDTIINFAAESHVDRSILEPDAFIKTDILGTFNLLESARKFDIKKFIQISTDEVYGSIESGSCTENSNYDPSSPYSASKSGAELLVKSYFKTYKMPVNITRSSNNFGPYQHPEKLIPLFVTNLLEGKKVPIYGSGKNVRDLIYVLDNCEAIDTILHKGIAGETYNIAGRNEISNLEVTNTILSELGKDASWIEFVNDRPGHDFRYAMDDSKIRKLGWQPMFGFEQAMRETINWYKKNEAWWKKVRSGEFSDYHKRQYGK